MAPPVSGIRSGACYLRVRMRQRLRSRCVGRARSMPTGRKARCKLSNPTLKDLVEQLKTIRSAIAAAGVETEETIDLEILALHIEEKIEMSAFDPLAAVADVAVPDFEKLK